VVIHVGDAPPDNVNISIDKRLNITSVIREATNPSFHLYANTAVSGNLIVASYNSKGVMVSNSMKAFSLASGAETTVQASVPEIAGGTYRFFFWDSNYIPMTAITAVADLP
jgi:hypothetical protein